MSAHTPKTLTCGCHTPNRYANGEMLFEFCSLHAAAPRMLDILKRLSSGKGFGLAEEARAILRDVEGESNG